MGNLVESHLFQEMKGVQEVDLTNHEDQEEDQEQVMIDLGESLTTDMTDPALAEWEDLLQVLTDQDMTEEAMTEEVMTEEPMIEILTLEGEGTSEILIPEVAMTEIEAIEIAIQEEEDMIGT